MNNLKTGDTVYCFGNIGLNEKVLPQPSAILPEVRTTLIDAIKIYIEYIKTGKIIIRPVIWQGKVVHNHIEWNKCVGKIYSKYNWANCLKTMERL